MEFNFEIVSILIFVAVVLAGYLWQQSQIIQALRDSVPPEYAEKSQAALIQLLLAAAGTTPTELDDKAVQQLALKWGIDLEALHTAGSTPVNPQPDAPELS